TTELITHAYFENVILNQVGSFPRKEFMPAGETLLSYAIGKIVREGSDVLALEGSYIALGLAGWAAFCWRVRGWRAEYIAWSGLFAFGSIVYVSKGGTEDYIFTLAEPQVSMFFGYLCILLFEFARSAQAPSVTSHVANRLL